MVEIRIVFERYDIQRSLKQTTRNKTQGTHILAVVHITDKTNIPKVHAKTIAAAICQHEGDYADNYLHSGHEEADTKLILHAADAPACGATSNYIMFS